MKLAARQPNEPMLIGRTWYFPDGGRAHLVTGAAEGEPVQVADDLTAVEDADLASLEQQVIDEIDRMLDEGSNDLAAMTALAEGLDRIRAESSRRDDEAAALEAQREELRQRIHPAAETDGDDDPDDGDDPGDGAPSADGGDTGAEADREPVTAAAAPVRRAPAARASAAATTRRAPRPSVPDAAQRVTITAAAELDGHGVGAPMDLNAVAVGLHDRARGLSDGSARARVAQFHLPFAAKDVIGKMTSNEGALDIMDRVAAPSRLFDTSGALTAAGWCTPSQNLYDLLALDGQSGLLQLPTVGIDRGGLNVPSYIGLDAADGSLWTWSEDQDAAQTITLTDLDIATGVGTATNSGLNLLNVGDMVDVRSTNLLANGPHTVTAVTDATHFTLNMTGVPDATNATGTAVRQKGCFRIPCPTWSDVRLAAYGLCISHGNLTDRAFPELTRRYVQLALNSHQHRMSSVMLAKIASTAHSDAVSITEATSDAFGELMGALELSIADYRSQYKISDSVALEVLLPAWTREALRADLAKRSGVDLLNISDAQIDGSFTVRKVRPQFLEDYLPLWSGSIRTTWPATTQFIIYPAGSFIEGNGGTIDLGVVRDSRLNATNDFTAAWSEQFALLARRGPKARKVTVTIEVDGVTACCP